MPVVAASMVSRQGFPAYQYLSPTPADMVAFGMQSKVSFNGLVLNDRIPPDRYVITDITGLGGADLRDSREPRPADHGEIARDAYWGGQTLTFEGTMEAGTVWELSRMERDLRAALGTLQELPMKFNWYDIRDEFSDPLGAAWWTAFSGGPFSIPGNGVAQFTNTSGGVAYRNDRQHGDAVLTCLLANQIPSNTSTVGLVAKCTASNSYLQGSLVQSASSSFSLSLQAVLPSGTVSLATTSAGNPISAGQRIWLQMVVNAETVTLSAYSQDPVVNPSATLLQTCTATLYGTVDQALGYGAMGFSGLAASLTTASAWAFEDFRVDALYPGDVQNYVRPVGQPQVTNAYQKGVDRYRRDFQFLVRASNPRWTCPAQSSATIASLAGGPSQLYLGRPYSRTYPVGYTLYINSAGQPGSQSPTPQAVYVMNRGTWNAQLILQVNGGITNPVLTNYTTGQSLKLNGVVAQGDVITVNSAKHTLQNAAGSNVFSMYDPSSSWPFLQRGLNALAFGGQSPVGTPSMTLMWNNTYK